MQGHAVHVESNRPISSASHSNTEQNSRNFKRQLSKAPRGLPLQSAMEYLMTYGWAILIIAIVLGVLYYLGVFTGLGGLPTSCVAVSGYLCQSPAMATGGTLSFQLGQSTGSSQYNIGVACAATANALGLPNVAGTANSFNYPATNGLVTAGTSNILSGAAPLSLVSGQTVTVTGLPCYGTTGLVLGSGQPVGTSFTGTLWYNYTAAFGAPTISSGTNPWLTIKIAKVTAKTV